MLRKLTIAAPALLLLASTVTVTWSGLNFPAPQWLGRRDPPPEEQFAMQVGGSILEDAREKSVFWSRVPAADGGAAAESSRMMRPPRGVVEGFRRHPIYDQALIRIGDVLWRLCHPIGLGWGEQPQSFFFSWDL